MPNRLRPYIAADAAEILRINNSEVPHVGALTQAQWDALCPEAWSIQVADAEEGKLAGFILILDQHASYASPNFLWFKKRYEKFVYVDRIAIDSAHQGLGLGRQFYRELIQKASPEFSLVTCEVNVRPPNPRSMNFHAALGFREVGQQDTEGGTKRVSLLALDFKW